MAHKSVDYKDKAWNKRSDVGVIYCRKIANKDAGNFDSVALYFDRVYNQNSLTSQRDRHLDKKAVLFVENREKT